MGHIWCSLCLPTIQALVSKQPIIRIKCCHVGKEFVGTVQVLTVRVGKVQFPFNYKSADKELE